MTCLRCNQELKIGDWPYCPHGSVYQWHAQVHEKERARKFWHPQFGWRTPGRSDQPMPERLRAQGFQEVDFPSIHSLERHSSETGSRAEVLDYNRNSPLAEKAYD